MAADIASGHHIIATVYVDCRSMYRVDGPKEMRPVGETEFVNGVAAMSASGLYGPTRACAGIISYVDMTLGARARDVLEAHIAAGNGRFRRMTAKRSRHHPGPPTTHSSFQVFAPIRVRSWSTASRSPRR